MIISHLPMKMFSFARYFLLFYFRQTIQQTLNWKKKWMILISQNPTLWCEFVRFFFHGPQKQSSCEKSFPGKWKRNLRKNLLRSKLSISPLKQYRACMYNDLHFIVHMWTHFITENRKNHFPQINHYIYK